MPAPAHLTKSSFLEGWRCRKALWLGAHRRDHATPPDEGALARMTEGQRVGALAREHVPGGTLIDAPSSEPARALQMTRAALDRGAPVLYEAAFERDGVFVRVDILRRRATGDFDLIEVKSSTSVKDEHVLDLAIQAWVVERDGLHLETVALLLINKDYVRHGPIDLNELFVLEDLTDAARAAAVELDSTVRDFGALTLQNAVMPTVEIGDVCTKPYSCSFKAHCWTHVPKRSIFDVSWLGGAARSQLMTRGIFLPADVPADFPADPRARAALDAARDGKERWDREKIRDSLGKLSHPLYFLDFEAIGPAIPPFDHTRPYDRIPFQFSVHVQDKPGGPIRHVGVLADPTRDFRASLAAELASTIGPKGTVLSWTSYEKTCIERLAQWATPAVAKKLASLLTRLWDLSLPFAQRLVVLPVTLGSYSVKQILPALVPELSYDDLEIGDGLAAVRAFDAMMDPTTSATERATLAKSLELYCERDTFAMVRILEVLRAHA